MDGVCDLTLVKHHTLRGNHQLVLAVVFSADRSNDPSVEFRDRCVDTQDIGVLFLTVPGNQSRDVSVIDGIG